jgi:glycosyltransferase involved in cell wall biosynthesis
MIEGLRDAFDLTVFARGASDHAPTHVVPPSRIATTLARIPLVNRKRAWQATSGDVQFDHWVAATMPRADIFQGAVGQSKWSLERARSLGATTVLDVVNMHVDQFAEAVAVECARFGVATFLSPWMHRRMLAEYERADLIRVMSHRAKETFLERGFTDQKIVVATPPFDEEEFPQADFADSTFRVAFVGLIEPWKGFHYLVEAFTDFPERDAELVFWGGTGARPIARYFARAREREPRISLRPVDVRSAGLKEVFGRASVLVHPSVTDGFGYAVGEAMASGLPVIVTPGAGAVDLVEDGVNGYIVPVRDPHAIRERLVHLAKNPALLRRMGHAAKKTVAHLTLRSFRENYVTRVKAL